MVPTLVAALVGLASLFYLAQSGSELFSDPHARRADSLTRERWDSVFGSQDSETPIPSSWIPPKIPTESDFTFVAEPDKFTIFAPAAHDDAGQWTSEEPALIYVPASSRTAVLSTGEELTLEAFAVGYPTSESTVETHSYDATSLAEMETTILPPESIFSYGVTFRARFSTNRFLHFAKRIHLFNAETRIKIGEYPWLYPDDKNRLEVTMPIVQWHPSPLLCVLDIDGGKTTSPQVPLQVGALIETAPVTCRIAFVEEFAGTSKSSSRSGNHLERKIDLHREEGSEGRSSLIGFVVVERRWIPESLGIMANTAEDTSGYSIGAEQIEDDFFMVDFPVPLSEIDSLKIIAPESQSRVVFELNDLPGLPPENQNVDNLFDVVVPNRLVGFQPEVEGIAQIAHLQNQAPLPQTDYAGAAREFKNQTLREITESTQMRYGWHSVSTTRDHRLVIRNVSFWESILDAIKFRIP